MSRVPDSSVAVNPSTQGGEKKQPWWKDWTSLALAILGIVLLSYPLVVTYMKNVGQAELSEAYRSSISTLDTQQQEYWLQRAREYNAKTAGMPILDPWLARVSKDNDPYRSYLAELNPSGKEEDPLGVITLPTIKTVLPIFHGTEAESLDRGVGHLYGSALPVGGQDMHSVLTAHSGLIEATMFDHLKDVKENDAFYIQVMGQTLKYQVYDIEVVLPEEVGSLHPEPGRDLVTLVTCTPYGVNTHRLLVHAERVPMDTSDEQAIEDTRPQVWRNWMTVVVLVLVLALLGHLWLGWRKRRKKDEEEDTKDNREEGRS